MKFIVTTCNEYDHLMPGFAHQFNLHWPGEKVDVLCYRKPPQLPINFNIVLLGKQPYHQVWTTPLIPYFEQLKEELFILMMDDAWPFADVDYTKYCTAQLLMEANHQSGRCHLHASTGIEVAEFMQGFNVMLQGSQYRTSLHSSIWDREYFLKYLKPDRTCWQFEVKGMKEAYNDGALILVPDEDILSYGEIYRNGKLNKGDKGLHEIAEKELRPLHDGGYLDRIS